MTFRNWMRENGTRNFIRKCLKRSDNGITLYFDKLLLHPSHCPVCPISAPIALFPRVRALGDDMFCVLSLPSACLGPTSGTPEPEGADKDDLLLLSEIFSASSLEEGEFSKEWAAVFGDDQLKEPAPTVAPGEPDPKPQTGSRFLPSQLLDQNMKDLQASLQGMYYRDWNEVFLSVHFFQIRGRFLPLFFFLSFFNLFSDFYFISSIFFFHFAIFFSFQL